MLWFPRQLQGAGRHDNPDLYGCMYAAAEPVGAIAETLAPFRGSGRLEPSMLRRAGRQLYLGRLGLADAAGVLDLDDPEVLAREGLRPSRVATRRRSTTQRQAARLHESHPEVVALRWWSTIESMLVNLTIFDRGAPLVALQERRQLSPQDPDVSAAAELLGLV
jgi:RES domain